jgi:MFS superfamily sulfate permease-like transporter
MHAAFVGVFLLFAAPLIRLVPLAALTGVLGRGVMEHDREGADRARSPLALGDRGGIDLRAVAIDLTSGILAGCLASILFNVWTDLRWRRASDLTQIDEGRWPGLKAPREWIWRCVLAGSGPRK